MRKLATRSRQEEQMDAVDLDPALYARVLHDLARVNRWTLTARPTISFLRRAAVNLDTFSLLDVGFGHGDMLRAIARWARRRGIEARLTGIDLNARSVAVARAATPEGLHIAYLAGDYLLLPDRFDFIISSQVAHHMTGDQLRTFLCHMEANARKGWLVSDLHRHAFSHFGFPVLARLMGVHRIVREDGKLSIARAFRPGEWQEILTDAGIPLDSIRIVRRFPFRLCVERHR
jgi:2-polyprenyl-3-methyl-5-hydroxy-6-metoxy-1,4-benzoquinol methylase